MSDWVEAADVSEFAGVDRKTVRAGGRLVGLFKVGTEFFAIGAECTHEKTSLVTGEVSGGEVTCPLHGARFDLRTGRNLSLPAVRPVPRYDVKVEGSKVFIRPA